MGVYVSHNSGRLNKYTTTAVNLLMNPNQVHRNTITITDAGLNKWLSRLSQFSKPEIVLSKE